MKHSYLALLLFLGSLFISGGVKAQIEDEDEEVSEDLYDIYCHYHWVWFHNSLNNQDNNTRLVDDYLANDIKVGVINIDR